jgi:hypothetical protein
MLHRSSWESMRDVAAAAAEGEREREDIPEQCIDCIDCTVDSRTTATRLFPLLHLHDAVDSSRTKLKGAPGLKSGLVLRPPSHAATGICGKKTPNPDHISKPRKKSDSHQTTTTTVLHPSTTPLHPPLYFYLAFSSSCCSFDTRLFCPPSFPPNSRSAHHSAASSGQLAFTF